MNEKREMQQYIDIYNEHRRAIEQQSPAAMNAARERALATLLSGTVPARGSDDYEATDLGEIFAPDYGVNINRVTFPAVPATFNCALPTLSAAPFHVVNDTFHAPQNAQLAPGVVVCAMRDADARCPGVLERYYNRLAADGGDITVALNTLLAQDGVLIHVPRGVNNDKPIQLINILNAAATLMAVRRVLIVLDDGAQASVLMCDHTSDTSRRYLNLQVVEIHLGRDAQLQYYEMEESSATTGRVSSLLARQERGSSLLVDSITLNNGTTRNNYRIDIDDEQCSTTLLGMAIAGAGQHIDNHTLINHRAPRCKSHEMFKYSLDDDAIGAFAGKIYVAPGCPGVDAYQGNRNLCGSPRARMYTKPQLEIYTDDVKCSHGATVGQLDREALFYMQQRGVSLEAARTLLKQAFMSDIVDAVQLPALRERLRHLVERRFTGADALCNNCTLSH